MKIDIQENLKKVKATVRYLINQNIEPSLEGILEYLQANKQAIEGKETLVFTTLLAIDDARKGQPSNNKEGYMFLYNLAKEILEENK